MYINNKLALFHSKSKKLRKKLKKDFYVSLSLIKFSTFFLLQETGNIFAHFICNKKLKREKKCHFKMFATKKFIKFVVFLSS